MTTGVHYPGHDWTHWTGPWVQTDNALRESPPAAGLTPEAAAAALRPAAARALRDRKRLDPRVANPVVRMRIVSRETGALTEFGVRVRKVLRAQQRRHWFQPEGLIRIVDHLSTGAAMFVSMMERGCFVDAATIRRSIYQTLLTWDLIEEFEVVKGSRVIRLSALGVAVRRRIWMSKKTLDPSDRPPPPGTTSLQVKWRGRVGGGRGGRFLPPRPEPPVRIATASGGLTFGEWWGAH